ncbi:MAG TPA: glyoxylate/hydroxypyruvate reductase A [Wenzhouxiangella sp.]
MALLICAPDRSNERLASDLAKRLPGVDVRIWPDVGEPTDIEFALLWKHPKGLVQTLPNLKAISSLGAGIEHLVSDPDIPATLPLGRLAGPKLAMDMATWLVGQVIAHWRDFARFKTHQANKQWQPWAPTEQASVGILGMGAMGAQTAKAFQALGFEVGGYSISGHGPESVTMHTGAQGLMTLAAQSDYLICLLPLTKKTHGILNQSLMASMRHGSVLINVGRGAHLVESDLLQALEVGRPAHAILDVFATEPLPKDHAFWAHPQITLSPHCAALTDPTEAADLAAQSYQNVMAGQAPLGQVKLNEGY